VHKRTKKDAWKATRDAHVAYEKLLSKFLKEKKAAYKESHTRSEKAASPSPTKAGKGEIVKKEAVKADTGKGGKAKKQ